MSNKRKNEEKTIEKNKKVKVTKKTITEDKKENETEVKKVEGIIKEFIETLDSKSIFVSNLDGDITNEEIIEHFSNFGTILEISIKKPMNKTRKAKSCIIKYTTDEEAEDAILNGKKIAVYNEELIVKKAIADKKNYLVYISNLPSSIEKSDVFELFKPCGQIKSILLQSYYFF
jgi:CUG-BP- and ETR3-like factor